MPEPPKALEFKNVDRVEQRIRAAKDRAAKWVALINFGR